MTDCQPAAPTPEAVCPLCDSKTTRPFFQQPDRVFRHCSTCDYVFVPPEHHLTREEERARYDLHQNHPDDPGYRRFLSTLVQPMLALLPPDARGLDFGCGPGPTLFLLFKEAGFEMDLYDPFYAPHPEVFQRRYDFITATEVAEHLRHPGEEWERLFHMLQPGGYLGIMTGIRPQPEAFSDWHYHRDPTHIGFYSPVTFAWIAARRDAGVPVLFGNVVIFQKPDHGINR